MAENLIYSRSNEDNRVTDNSASSKMGVKGTAGISYGSGEVGGSHERSRPTGSRPLLLSGGVRDITVVWISK